MSVWMWAFANHKIDFSEDAETLIDKCIKALDSLVELDFQITPPRKWHLEEINDDEPEIEYLFQTHEVHKKKRRRHKLRQYDVLITPTYMLFFTGCFNWVHWYHPVNESETEARDMEIEFIHKVTKLFGGDTIVYFPDNMFDVCKWMPGEYTELTFEETIDQLYANHDSVFSSLEEACKSYSCPGGRVYVEHI